MDINLGLTTLTVNPTTQADVWRALEQNESFPDRTIAFGDSNAKYGSGDILFNPGGGAHISLTASFSAGGHSGIGIGIYGSATDAVKSLGLDPSVTPDFPARPDDRFLLLGFRATAQGSVSGTAPVGVVSSVTFGAKASGATRYAILYRFNKAAGARTVLEQAHASNFRALLHEPRTYRRVHGSSRKRTARLRSHLAQAWVTTTPIRAIRQASFSRPA